MRPGDRNIGNNAPGIIDLCTSTVDIRVMDYPDGELVSGGDQHHDDVK